MIHGSILRKSAPLFALASKGQPVSLSKLGEGAAHTLVHYLYAGTFETQTGYTPLGQFRLSTRVYCAAIRYQLPSLTGLAREKIVHAGELLPIFDILEVARDDAFPLLPEADVWYSDYLEDVIKKAMAEDPEPFRRPAFITKVEGNSRLLQIVWKTVMSSYATVPASVSMKPPSERSAETPLAESLVLTESEALTQDSLHSLPSPTESTVDSPPSLSEIKDLQEPEKLSIGSAAQAGLKKPNKPSLERKQSKAQADAASNDDFGLPAIEPTIKQSEVLETVSIPPTEVTKPEHVRSDSVVEADAAAPDDSFDEAKRGVSSEAAHTASTGNQDTMKKNKKKSKKRNTSIVF